MRATFVAAGGHFLSGGSVTITNDDLNSESISTLIEHNNFDYLVSGDLTGGGSTSTAKTPDVETYVGQMVGDVDVVQLDHHGSTTANNQTFLSALKAEVAVRADRRDQHLRSPEPRDRQQVPQHARHRRQQLRRHRRSTRHRHRSRLLSERSQSCRRRSRDAAGLHRRGPGQRGPGHDRAVDRRHDDLLAPQLRRRRHPHRRRRNIPMPSTACRPASPADFEPTRGRADRRRSLPLANEATTITAVVNDRESPISSVSLALQPQRRRAASGRR